MQNRKTTGKVLIAMFILLLLICLLWALYTLYQQEDFSGVMYSVEEMTKEQKQETEKQIEFPGFSDTTLTAGQRENMMFVNPEKNEVTFEYVISDKDSKRILYTTEHMAPGSALAVNMVKLFGTGRHDACICVNTFSIKDGSPRNNMEFNLKLNVKNG